jgi:RNA polymerase sigma factor (sigma-70 family)
MYANECDDSLIKKFRAGNSRCFDVLLERYQQRVFSYIYQMVRDQDTSNDIFQEVFIKVIRSLKKDSYNHEGKLLSWILRISHNQVIDYFRKNSKMPIAGRSSNYD